MKKDHLSSEFVEALENWAQWARRNDVERRLGYGQTLIGQAYMPRNPGAEVEPPPVAVDDGNAEKMEQAVIALTRQQRIMGQLIIAQWVYGWSVTRIAKHIKDNRANIPVAIRSAEEKLEAIYWVVER